MPSTAVPWRAAIRWRPTTAISAIVLLGVGFALLRAFGVFGTKSLQPLLPLGFVLMMILPWLLLSRAGRQQIGIARAGSVWNYAGAALSGALLAALCGVLGGLLFGNGADNWFVSIAHNYQRAFNTSSMSVATLFIVFIAPAVMFSPLREELFFRGLLQRTLETKLSKTTSTHLECGAFALVHLCHHGMYWPGQSLALKWWSGALWMLLMYAAARLFAYWRQSSGSIFPAVVAHIAFNISMNLSIFGVMWTWIVRV